MNDMAVLGKRDIIVNKDTRQQRLGDSVEIISVEIPNTAVYSTYSHGLTPAFT